MEQITRQDVTYLYHCDYYDGPLSGACLWRGRRYWFRCVERLYPPVLGPDGRQVVDEYGDPMTEDVRVFHLFDMPTEWWAAEDSRVSLWRECVGAHCDYDPVTQRRQVGALRPQTQWGRYYAAYPPPTGEERFQPPRPPVARYEA